MKRNEWNHFALASVACLMAMPGNAYATPDAAPAADTEAQPADRQEIVVTGARQRSESAQAAPVATTVLTPKMLEQVHGSDITSVATLVPNLIVQESNNVVGLPAISLRGFSTKSSDIAAEPGVAIYIDGVYQTLQPGSLSDTFDLQSLEVLRGPQGTLLGRNAPAGAILISRTRPTGELGVKAQVETGSFNLLQGQALVNFPIIKDVLSAKVYGNYRRRDGYIYDRTLDRDVGDERRGTIRGALLFTPSTDFSLYLTADYMGNRSESKPTRNIATAGTASCAFFGFCNLDAGTPNVTSADYVPPVQQNDYSTTAVADWNVGPVTLRSTTGYRKYDSNNGTDLDGTPAIILHAFDNVTNLKSISEEFRINSVKNGGLDLDGRFDWVIGFYYAHSNAYYVQNINAFGGLSITSQAERIYRNNYAVFADGEFAITEPWSVSFGVRRSRDEIDHRFSLSTATTYPVPTNIPDTVNREKASFNRTSFTAGTRYKISADKLIYFRYSQGYLAGTFNGLPASLNPAANLVLPETSESYEVGLKTDWFDNRVRFNLTLFDVKFKNHQVSIVQSSSTGLQQAPANADVKTKGVEAELMVRPVDAFTLRANVSYLDAKYGKFIVNLGNGQTQSVTGEQIALAPKFSGTVGADYVVDVNSGMLENITLHGDMSFTTKQQTSYNGGAIGIQKGYSYGNASVTFNAPDDRYALSVYVNNVTDEHWIQNTQILAGLVDFVQDNIGRTWGASLSVKF